MFEEKLKNYCSVAKGQKRSNTLGIHHSTNIKDVWIERYISKTK